MACFSAPVYQIAGIAGAGFDRDRGLEQLAHGLGFSCNNRSYWSDPGAFYHRKCHDLFRFHWINPEPF
jgi:hypothetical protein